MLTLSARVVYGMNYRIFSFFMSYIWSIGLWDGKKEGAPRWRWKFIAWAFASWMAGRYVFGCTILLQKHSLDELHRSIITWTRHFFGIHFCSAHIPFSACHSKNVKWDKCLKCVCAFCTRWRASHSFSCVVCIHFLHIFAFWCSDDYYDFFIVSKYALHLYSSHLRCI